MRREEVLKEMKRRGKRITEQRKILVDIILENPHNSCKEVYYEAVKKDSSIGIATVYRMMNLMEEIGAISRFYSIPVYEHPMYDRRSGRGISVINGRELSAYEQEDLYRELRSLLTSRGILEHEDKEFEATIVVNE